MQREHGLRPQSRGEEIANSISHGVGFLASLVGAPFLIVATVREGSTWNVVGASIFVASMLMLYLSSTLYHALPQERVKRVFWVFDHGSIYLLIAGTYTPFTLGVLRGGWGWTLFGLVWGMAVLGITLKASGRLRRPIVSTLLYLGMAWLIVIAVRPLWQHVQLPGLLWLAAGGLFYTGGVGFYVAKRVRYSHLVWHFFVLAGTACHYFAILWYASNPKES
jgi:hemolysin III